ncbi:hypothetical protein ACWD62_43630 [Streptomyces sp. NPDC005146]
MKSDLGLEALDRIRKERAVSSDNKWMVGVRFHSGGGRAVSHFYLVDGAISGAEARSVAVSKAERAAERAARNDAELDASWVRVQRVVHDLLGNIGLSAPLPHEEAAPARGPALSLSKGTS